MAKLPIPMEIEMLWPPDALRQLPFDLNDTNSLLLPAVYWWTSTL